MDARGVLDQLLQSGSQIWDQGRQAAEEHLGVPASGEGRDAMIDGLGKGALAGALLALMLGSKGGRKLSGKVLKYGSLAAAAAVAYKACLGWQSRQLEEDTGMSINDLDDQAAEGRGVLLVRTMIAAANADGHIDDRELKSIQARLAELDLSEDTVAVLQSEFTDPLDPEQLADEVDSTAAASEVYFLSALVIDNSSPAERDYLSRLASALRLPMELANELEEKAFA